MGIFLAKINIFTKKMCIHTGIIHFSLYIVEKMPNFSQIMHISLEKCFYLTIGNNISRKKSIKHQYKA